LSGIKQLQKTIKNIQPEKVDSGTLESLHSMLLLPSFSPIHSLIKDKLSQIEAFTLNLKQKQHMSDIQKALSEKTAKEERQKKAQEIRERLTEELNKRLSELPDKPFPYSNNNASSAPIFTFTFTNKQLLDENQKKPLDK
jgi:hypothetical protein